MNTATQSRQSSADPITAEERDEHAAFFDRLILEKMNGAEIPLWVTADEHLIIATSDGFIWIVSREVGRTYEALIGATGLIEAADARRAGRLIVLCVSARAAAVAFVSVRIAQTGAVA